jgi:hypothetical protein
MTKSEYQELVEFLGPKLEAIEKRLTRVEVLGEEDRHQMRVVAEGVGAVWSEVKAVRSEMAEGFAAVRSESAAEFKAVRSEMAEGFAAVRSEMDEGFRAVRSEMAAGFDAQGRLIRGLGSRVGHLEA